MSQLGRGAGVVREAGDHEYGGLAAFPPTTVGRLFGAIGDVVLEAVTVLHGADIGAENPGVVGERSAPLASRSVQHCVGWLPASNRP